MKPLIVGSLCGVLAPVTEPKLPLEIELGLRILGAASLPPRLLFIEVALDSREVWHGWGPLLRERP
jgi:hypothetical protein